MLHLTIEMNISLLYMVEPGTGASQYPHQMGKERPGKQADFIGLPRTLAGFQLVLHNIKALLIIFDIRLLGLLRSGRNGYQGRCQACYCK